MINNNLLLLLLKWTAYSLKFKEIKSLRLKNSDKIPIK